MGKGLLILDYEFLILDERREIMIDDR